MTITEELLPVLRADMGEALAAVGKKHSLSFRVGKAGYGPLLATFRIEVTTIGEDGRVVSKELACLRMLYGDLGLTEAHLTQEFTVLNRRFTLSGFKNTGGAQPFIARCANDGREYLLTHDQVQRGLGLGV